MRQVSLEDLEGKHGSVLAWGMAESTDTVKLLVFALTVEEHEWVVDFAVIYDNKTARFHKLEDAIKHYNGL